jgi:predicted DNA-binding transcriptional regulator YafY
MAASGGYRNRMRDECVRMQATLLRRKTIRMQDLADECGISLRTTYRWVDSFSMIMPIRLDKGMVIVGEG